MIKEELYEITCIHEAEVRRSRKRLAEIDAPSLSAFFNVLADENRFKIAYALTYEPELCVCDVATIIEATVATTSHHLQTLKKLGVVNSRKKGKMAYYFIEDERVAELVTKGLKIKEAAFA